MEKPFPNQEGKNQNTNGERFKNICYGVAAVGAMILPYLQYFLG